jgi:hypothetical protein
MKNDMTNDLSITTIYSLEENIAGLSRNRLAGLLSYFKFIQETLVIAFDNDGKPLALQNVPNNPKLFAYISTTRAFSLSRVAMDITIKGYPFEGMALTRTLLELLQCTQYLVRHPQFIENFMKGNLKLEKVLQKAKKEGVIPENNNFGRFWGLLSNYAHATPDSLVLPLRTTDENKITISLVINDTKRIDDTAYGIMLSLLTYYLIFRGTLENDLDVTDKLIERDKFIFDLQNIRKYAKFDSISDQDLEQLYSFFTVKGEE